MKPKENHLAKLKSPHSPIKQSPASSHFTPQNNRTDSVKRQLSPSNSPSNFHTKATIKKKDNKQQNVFLSVQIQGDKGNNKRSEGRVEKLESENRVLTEGIEELRKQNMELMDNNGELKNQIFERESDRMAVRRLEEEIFRLEREMEGLETEVKEKNNFINIQMMAKQHNAKLIDDMNFQLREMHHIFDEEKQKVNLANVKIKKLQEQALKQKKKIRQLEATIKQKQNKQSNQSTRLLDRQNENLKQKIKVLEGINERQKQQITDLLSAIGTRQVMHSTTSSDFKLEVNGQPFDHQYSQILHRCVTENDSEELRSKIGELEGVVMQLRNENRLLKERIGLTRTKTSIKQMNDQINDLMAEKQQYEILLREQHSKLVDMNEQIFQMNHENHVLREEKQHYYEMGKHMELTGLKLTAQLEGLYEDKIKAIEHIKVLAAEVEKYSKLKQDYEILEEEYQCVKEETQENELLIEQLNRKNKQLLIYVEELRISQQSLNDQLIDKQTQIQELKSTTSQHPPVISKFQPVLYKDESKIEKLLRERNIKIINGMAKFRQTVLNQIKMMELELLVAQSTYKGLDSQEVIVKLKRRVKSILQNN